MSETPAELRETERRVLAHLPAYRTPEGHEAAIVSALESGTITSREQWPVGRTLTDLTARVAADPYSKVEGPGDEAFVGDVIATLTTGGLVETADGEIRMTEAGLNALTA